MTQENTKGNFYITTPIYYVNDAPHIGHAYTSLACDCLARFKRMEGYDVKFLTGTDEHGQKVEKSALKKGKKPQEFCDQISVKFEELAKFLDISNDDFIRTTQNRHKKTAQRFWQKLQDNGWIYLDVYEGWYAVRDEAFYNEDELVDGKAPTGAKVEWHKEESYFFKLSEFQDILLEIYDKLPDFIQPESRKNEVIAFVKGGKKYKKGALKDLSISRTSFDWGIKVPGNEKHVIYVWLDALTNYIAALNYPDGEEYKQFWERSESDFAAVSDNKIEPKSKGRVHIVGKDILRFHAVYWPAFLLASQFNKKDLEEKIAAIQELKSPENKFTSFERMELIKHLPDQIFAHGWWTNEGQKISKSIGNIIDPYVEIEWIKSFGIAEDTAIDYFRYFLIREIPFGNDGNYSREHLILRINAELANNIGNLIQRTLSMIVKNCNGVIPEDKGANIDYRIEKMPKKTAIPAIEKEIENLQFNKALSLINLYSSVVNAGLHIEAPWNLKKEGKIERMNSVLYHAADSIRRISILLLPFIPKSAKKILNLLNIDKEQKLSDLDSVDSALKAGHAIKKPQAIFAKMK